jgi:HAE1 family hydrophobic/amphiphilic exporter-1
MHIMGLIVTGPSVESAMNLQKLKPNYELFQEQQRLNYLLKMEPEINVQVDRDKMSALGLTTVGMTMQTAYSGNTDGKFRAGEYEYDINIKYNAFDRKVLLM